jgi:hypothetical protein
MQHSVESRANPLADTQTRCSCKSIMQSQTTRHAPTQASGATCIHCPPSLYVGRQQACLLPTKHPRVLPPSSLRRCCFTISCATCSRDTWRVGVNTLAHTCFTTKGCMLHSQTSGCKHIYSVTQSSDSIHVHPEPKRHHAPTHLSAQCQTIPGQAESQRCGAMPAARLGTGEQGKLQ